MVSVSRIRVKHLAEQENRPRKRSSGFKLTRALLLFRRLLQSLTVILTSTMGSILALEAVGGVGGFILGTVVMTVAIALRVK